MSVDVRGASSARLCVTVDSGAMWSTVENIEQLVTTIERLARVVPLDATWHVVQAGEA